MLKVAPIHLDKRGNGLKWAENAVDAARLDYGKSDIARISQAISTFCSSDIARILVLSAISVIKCIIKGYLKFKEPSIILLVADIADKTNIRAIS